MATVDCQCLTSWLFGVFCLHVYQEIDRTIIYQPMWLRRLDLGYSLSNTTTLTYFPYLRCIATLLTIIPLEP